MLQISWYAVRSTARTSVSDVAEPAGMVEFVNLALSQNDRTGICKILHEAAEVTGSAGAILWELDPDIPVGDPNARLFTAGHWFRSGKRFAEHDLPVARSFTGDVLLKQKPDFALIDDPRCSQSDNARDFYHKHGIAKFHAAPVRFVDDTQGVLEVFRTAEKPDFISKDHTQLETFCSLLPYLHDSLHNKVSFRLINEVKDILQGAPDAPASLSQTWGAVCQAIQGCFCLIEASLFLEDSVLEPGEFRVAATTCPKYVIRDMYRPNEPYKTSWVITQGKRLRIWDLRRRNDPKEKSIIQRFHDGVTWDEADHLEETTAEILGRAIPPLSFIAEPVFSGSTLCGVLRCCASKEAPYYFAKREQALLAVVASQIGQFWSKWLNRRTVRQENQAWIGLVQKLKTLNYSVHSELGKKSPDVQNVLRKSLDAVSEILPGGEIADVRLIDYSKGEGKDELYYVLTKGAWTEAQQRLRFPVSKQPPQSAGAKVYQNFEKTAVFSAHELGPDEAISKDVRAMIVAPIAYGGRCYGVIDLRNTRSRQFPVYAEPLAEIFGRQLGLYHGMIDTVHDLRKTEKKLQEQRDEAEQAFADWQHQIRGPINQAYQRIREVLRFEFRDYSQTPQYLRIQSGLLAKAKRASQGLRLFLDLARNQSLKVKPVRVDTPWLAKLLVQTCLDNQILWAKKRQVSFDVDADSFQRLASRPLFVDRDLTEQALNNIIDNAFKYSYRRTEIRIAGAGSECDLCLTISNEGIPLTEAEVKKLGTRGWRAEKALSVVGEGTGLGLWVVDSIMKAHGGRLEVRPTLQQRTEVRLYFPWDSRKA